MELLLPVRHLWNFASAGEHMRRQPKATIRRPIATSSHVIAASVAPNARNLQQVFDLMT
jgi:hypothetical protein